MKRLSAALSVLVLACTIASAVDLTQIPRVVTKEPAYQSQPRYCLVVFGPEAATRVWIVHDGDALYADLNGDGDLTEPAERFSAKQANREDGTFSFDAGEVRDGDLLHKSLSVSVMDLSHLAQSEPQIATTLKRDPAARFYAVGLDAELPGRRGSGIGGRVTQAAIAGDTNGVLRFADSIEDAPLIHFGHQSWQVTICGHLQLTAGRQKEVYLGVGTPGLGPGTTAYVAYDQLIPAGRFPKLEIAFSGEGDAEKPHEYVLTQRCCTYNFHGPVRVPDGITPGEVTVKVSFHDWFGGFVATSTHRVQVVAPKVQLTLDPVSPRLTRSLIHPTRDGVLQGVRYSPDGKRLIAGDYPGGIVQMWDVDTGNQLSTIDLSMTRPRSQDFFHVTPDWSSIYAARFHQKLTRFERDGKNMHRWEFDGDVCEWDLASGELKQRLQHRPPRNITVLVLSPDGRYFLTGDEIPGEYEGRAPRRLSLWDAGTRTSRDVCTGSVSGVFSLDSKLVATDEMSEDYYSRAIRLIDTATGETVRSVPIDDEFSRVSLLGFSPDGTTLIGQMTSGLNQRDRARQKCSLLFWDVASGEPTESISARPGEVFSWPAVVSLDGDTLALTNWYGEHPLLYLIDLTRKDTVATVRFGTEKAIARSPAFSPDGRWVGVITQVVPEELARQEFAAEDVPQPRIHLIQAATGEIRETIVSPQALASSLAFSPDGKTLATGGNGCVLLWDLTTPPGELAAK